MAGEDRPSGEARPQDWPDDRRDALALAVARLCAHGPLHAGAGAAAAKALLPLARAAEARVRAAMAEELADAPWAPPAVVRWLAFDQLEVARPVLERSLALSDADLVALAGSDRARRLVIAGRAKVSAQVCAALARWREVDVIRTLVDNAGAELQGAAVADVMAAARADDRLQAALAGRAELPRAFARALFVVAAGEIRAALLKRFPDLPRDRIADAAEAADAAAAAGASGPDTMAATLHAQGGLTPAFALRALNEGRHDVFDEAVAQLTGVPAERWRRALAVSSLRAAALACRAMAIDAAAVPAAYDALARAGRAHAIHAADVRGGVQEIYQMYRAQDASRALNRLGEAASIAS